MSAPRHIPPSAPDASKAAAPAAPRRRRSLKGILPYLGILVGLVIVGFYPASEAIDAWRRDQVAVELDQRAATLDTSQKDELLAQARAYNECLAGDEPEIAEQDIWPYERQLSPDGADTPFAYVIIPGIDLTMPVYHGTDDAALSAGVGHLEYTSLPIGGVSTHAVLSAHSGMSGMRAFDEIDQLHEGDVFGIRVLGDLYCYRVTGSEVVLPDETGSLAIRPGEDLCTLVTCTPYGVNDHRLLVHAERCEVPDGFGQAAASPATVITNKRVWPLLVAIVAIVLVFALVNHRRRSGRPRQMDKE